MSKKSPSSDDFLKQAYAMKDDQSKLEFYKKWADEYDDQMQDNLGYRSPQILSRVLVSYLDNKFVPLLDVGCGTGLTAHCLTVLGCTLIDGIDYSQQMIAVARSKEIYNKLLMADLNKPIDIPDNQYGALICTGTFTHGHVGPQPITELIRITKPNGFLACTVHRDLWKSAGFEQTFGTLESSGRLKKLYLKKNVFFKDGEREGWFCVYQKIV